MKNCSRESGQEPTVKPREAQIAPNYVACAYEWGTGGTVQSGRF